LGRFFNTGAEIWMNLQKAYELDVVREKLGNTLEEIIPYQFIL
jgi:plasmid maintenance system antidote protein VapI